MPIKQGKAPLDSTPSAGYSILFSSIPLALSSTANGTVLTCPQEQKFR
jgi:hypothetical protein